MSPAGVEAIESTKNVTETRIAGVTLSELFAQAE
jgi:hypothetical protein